MRKRNRNMKWEDCRDEGCVKVGFCVLTGQLTNLLLEMTTKEAAAVFSTVLDEEMVKVLPKDAAQCIGTELFRVCGTTDPYAWEDAVYEVLGKLLPDFLHMHHYCSYDLHVFCTGDPVEYSLSAVLKKEIDGTDISAENPVSVVKFIPCVKKNERYRLLVFEDENMKFYGKDGIIHRFVKMLKEMDDICLEGYLKYGGAGGNFSHDGMDETYYTLFDDAEHWGEELLAEKSTAFWK